ncbi:GtrA family protein [Saccharopolyspora dendranthemae]|uniref:Putative flippase GtrA n=1 Tax=Saccharopolyspora dendranthemae TaxID=1181886 RepID=A0A561U554_9PSEU|nr:GtrA family protein [Saccharopolyspora dendranthemae]TWF94463.1 putative flippase GtrA [Saccharopolyspora dendranthemae]
MTKIEPRPRLISRELLLYTVIGGSGVLLDYLLFLVLFNYVGMHHQLANVLSTTAGITNNFVLNSLFNFRKTDRIVVRFLRFYAVGIAGIVLTFLLLAVFSTGIGIDANLVKLASLPVVLLFQYTINKRWSFG